MQHVSLPGADGLQLHVRRVRPRRSPVVADVAGPVVLLLHGWPGTGDDWSDVLASAAETMPTADVLAPDLRGFGSSGRPAGDDPARYGPDAHVVDLRLLLDGVGARHVVVAGYDLGATVAQQLARADDRVTALVLGCPSYPGIGERRHEPAIQAELWYQHLHRQPWAADLVAHDRATLSIYLRHFYEHWWGTGSVDPAHFRRVVDAYAADGAFDASIGWYRARAGTHSADAARVAAAGPITVPTTVLWGEEDPVVPLRLADRLGEYFSDLEFVRLPGVGHFIPLESPAAVGTALAKALHAGRTS